MATVLDEFTTAEAAKAQDAAKDLERIEQEVVAEAEASVEDAPSGLPPSFMAKSVRL